MDYKRIYDQLVDGRKSFPAEGEKEIHHIIPRSMGGSNDKDNLVALTPREHFFAHYLLAKIHNNKSMWCAYWFMCNTKDYKVTSRQYESARKLSRNAMKGNQHTLGHVLTEEHKKNIGNGVRGAKNGNYGRNFTEEHRKRISESSKGRKHDEKSRKRMIEAAKNKERVTCPHCSRVLDKGNYVLWHGDKCKMKVG